MQARLEPGDTVECRNIDDMIARSSKSRTPTSTGTRLRSCAGNTSCT